MTKKPSTSDIKDFLTFTHSSRCYFFISFLIIFIFISTGYGEKITWVGTISNQSDLHGKSSLGGKLFNFVFGDNSVALIHPVAVTRSMDKELWILDQGLQTPVSVDFDKSVLKYRMAGQDQKNPSVAGICIGENNLLYFTDSFLNKIFTLNPGTNTKHIFAEGLSIDQPTGIAWSPFSHQIYVCETGKHRILVIDTKGRLTKTIGARGAGRSQFNYPNYLWIDPDGLLYVVDAMNFRVQLFSPEGDFISMFGEAGNSSGYLARPKGIATDSDGNIYLVDALFHTVQIFDREGNYLYSFGKQGKGQAEFWLPSGIFIDSTDKIYVADSYNSRIQIFQYISGKLNDN